MSQEYFNSLNYTLGNEDTTFDVEVAKRNNSKNILSVAGSGGRSLPLIGYNGQAELHCCDLSQEQLCLTELREALYRQVSYADFAKFFAYPPYGEYDYTFERKKIFESLELSDYTKEYFKRVFESLNWETVLYQGKWEKTFNALSKVLRLIMGKEYDEILKFHDLDEQKLYYENAFPHKKWKAVLFLLGNKSVFNALLYKGDFIQKNVEESHFQYYFNAFDRLFKNDLARNSFFLHLCFYGRLLHEDGVPCEGREETFNRIKKSLSEGAKVHRHCSDIISCAKDLKELDFVGLSDVPSYFKGDMENNFMQLIKPSLKVGGVVVVRYYLRVCDVNLKGFEDISDDYSMASDLEKVQMYRIKVFKKIN